MLWNHRLLDRPMLNCFSEAIVTHSLAKKVKTFTSFKKKTVLILFRLKL